MKKNTFQRAFTRASFAGLVLAATASSALAQTSGTLAAPASFNWSTAPWTITSGTGTYPDGGGVATLNTPTGNVPGTLAAGTVAVLDVPINLSGININSGLIYQTNGTATNNLTLAATGGTFNIIQSAVPTPISFSFGHTFLTPIAGGGTAGLIKTGAGTMALGSTTAGSSFVNTYTGGTRVNGGTLVLSATAATGDGVLGATGAGNGIFLDGGTIFTNVTGGLTTARDVALGAGGGTFVMGTAATINGVISGNGSLTQVGFQSVVLTLGGANTYTGATTLSQFNASLALTGAGSIAGSSSYDLVGTLALNSTAANANRLNDTAPITSHGTNITLTGNASTATAEVAGALTLAGGNTNLAAIPNATAAASLSLASVTRNNNSTLFVRGNGLGGTPGTVNVATITAGATGPALVGGGGAAGSTNISIVPWATGNSANLSAFTAAGTIGSSLVTYDGTNGFRPLAATEYAADFTGAATNNVRLTAATAVPANSTANALVFAPSAAAILSGGTINLTSGAFLYSPTATATGTVSAGLNFGAAEGVITYTSPMALSGAISGSGGVTYASPAGGTVTPTGASTYTGNTTLNGNSLSFSGVVPAAGNASIFGNSGTVVLNGGATTAFLQASAASTLNRPLSIVGTGNNYVGASGSGYAVTYAGDINLQTTMSLYGNAQAAASAISFTGNITGPGAFSDTGLGYAVLSGNNSYSGGTTISSSTFVAGSDTAFGTGVVNLSNASAVLQGSGTTARTLANNFLIAATATFGGTAPLTLNGNVSLNGGTGRTLAFTNTALTAFGGVISNGAITKTGTGAVAFNSPTGNTYTGGFLNAAGNASAIYANNTSGSAFGTGAVSIGATSATAYSTLAGTFTTSGATSVAGRLSPGNTPAALLPTTAGIGAIGTANFNGAFTLSSATTSSLYLEASSNVTRDQLNVGGAFTLNGTVFIATTGGYSISQGTIIDFADWASITVGTVTFNTTGATVDPGVTLDTSFFAIDGTIRTLAVPEPTTWAMFGVAGALGLAGYVRRRRAA